MSLLVSCMQGRRSLWDRGDMSPNILEVMSFRLGLFYPVTATIVVCCILMQIFYVVSQKSFSFSPITPTGAPPLDPAGGLRPPDLQSFYIPQ